ncbi:MAG: EAL domain-containing protein [Gammaproteobacteria bacterium]|nr:EAL domain-containing protein [Gammaproteobacteria bacterium]
MFFKAAKRSSAPAAAPGAPAAPATPATVEALGQQLREALPARRLHSLSLCDHEANVLWLSEGALGPDEHGLVMEALAVLAADTSLPCHEMGLEDGRFAIFLPVRTPTGAPVGIAMILADRKSVGDDTLERMLAAPVRAIMQRLAILLRPEEAANGKGAVPVLALEPEEDEDPLPSIASVRIPVVQPAPGAETAAPAAVITPQQIDDILEFDVVETPPVPVAEPVPAPTTSAGDMVELDFAPAAPRGPAARPLPTTPPPPEPELPEEEALPGLAAAPVPEPAAPVTVPEVPAPAATAAQTPEPKTEPPPVAPPAPPASVARLTPRATPFRPAHLAAAAPAEPVAPARTSASADSNLMLELLPIVKLRAGGQTRRYQVLARAAAAHRDPAAFDTLVLQRLLGWLAAHRAAWSSQPSSFTVTLSISTLEDERFAQKIAATLNAHGIAPENLGFEIGEPLCTQRRAQVERFLTQCDKLGSWAVIDDFSFDSQVLPLLRSKALRLVKIHPRLSSSALKDKLSQSLVVATVQAAKVLGIHCAAKKVDSQAALQWLTAIGCDFAQGAAVALAQPLEALASSPDPTGITAMAPPLG